MNCGYFDPDARTTVDYGGQLLSGVPVATDEADGSGRHTNAQVRGDESHAEDTNHIQDE